MLANFGQLTRTLMALGPVNRTVSSLLTRCLSSSSRSSIDLTGIYPPITTPFHENEDINWGKLESNLEIWGRMPFRGFVVQGSNGEYVYLTRDERIQMVDKVRRKVSDKQLIIAGSGSTRETITMSEKMAEAGADAVLVCTPCFYKGKMNHTSLIKHYKMVADKSPVPVILYSVPANTGIDLAPEVILSLCKHPNIIGLKDSGGDISKIGYLCYRTKDEDFQILAGSASFLLPSYELGCVGGVCALANVLGEQVCQLHTLYHKGDIEAAVKLQHRLIAPNTAVTRSFGVPGLKTAMEWYGLYGGPTRRPLTPITEDEINQLKSIFRQNKFL
ncbi:4-hydroxy-2-oxoglutarate aldolase, mitochondrial-like isoform X2 [Tubulanus polymorphus]|uniref:4-hydroxy-2-oxoglutarate aldolase, mitochondrial-like isoform X2 n=1 Tax=Tubulanus polymorphus TaxID=672921 RepID=UPI003DA57F6B